jgi:hypothetical protein
LAPVFALEVFFVVAAFAVGFLAVVVVFFFTTGFFAGAFFVVVVLVVFLTGAAFLAVVPLAFVEAAGFFVVDDFLTAGLEFCTRDKNASSSIHQPTNLLAGRSSDFRGQLDLSRRALGQHECSLLSTAGDGSVQLVQIRATRVHSVFSLCVLPKQTVVSYRTYK